jgi:hypothetical protein
MLDSLHPDLERHGVAVVGDIELGQGRRPVRLEAAKGVGQVQAEAFVEPTRHLDVDPPPLLGGTLGRVEYLEIAAPGNDVGLGQVRHDLGDERGLVLSVAVERDQAIVSRLDRPLEGATESGAVAPVPLVPDDLDGREGAEQPRSPVGRSIIDHQDVVGIPQDLGQDGLEVGFLVVDRDRGEHSHRLRMS